LLFIPSAILIYLDQLTKKYAKDVFFYSPYKLIDNIIEFTYHENRGAAFGIMQNQHIIFYIITFSILIFILYLIKKIDLNKKNFMIFICIILIFSGAIGNLIDRIVNKYVIDFIYFKPIDFPVFNLADTYITIACFLFIFLSVFVYKDKEIF
jgi:signal peptidase II